MQSVLITAKCKLMQVVGLIRVWCVATTPYQKKNLILQLNSFSNLRNLKYSKS